MILAILAFWFGYKKGRDSGRNPILWSVICGGTFIGVQILVAIAFGVVIGAGVELWGWNETLYNDLSWVITIASIVSSIIAILILFRFLDRIPIDEVSSGPPPPPSFDQNL